MSYRDSAKVEVGKPGRGGSEVPTVEYEGATRRMSLVETLGGGMALRVGVTTNEANPTERRPNYKIDVEIPLDAQLFQFLSGVLDRAEEIGLDDPMMSIDEGDLMEAIHRFARSGARISPLSGFPLADDLNVVRAEDVVRADDVLLTLDGQPITEWERDEFRSVVNGGPYILKSETEAFRRFRATRRQDADVDELRTSGALPLDGDENTLTDDSGNLLMVVDGKLITLQEVIAFREFHGGTGYITVDELEKFREFRTVMVTLPNTGEILGEPIQPEDAGHPPLDEDLVQPDAVDEAGAPNR